MVRDKKVIIAQIAEIANTLELKYSTETNFRNHCYLRIAYDCTLKNKWDTIISKPFVKNANFEQITNVVELLNRYLLDKNKLITDNSTSLNFRKLAKLSIINETQTLF